MKRNLLNEGWYTATIMQVNHSDILELVWVVDTGDDKWAKVFQRFDTSSRHAVDRFEKMCDGIMFILPKLYQLTEVDSAKLLGQRGNIKVIIVQKNNLLVNVIAEYSITDSVPEIDPFKEKTDEVFRVSATTKKLPIWK